MKSRKVEKKKKKEQVRECGDAGLSVVAVAGTEDNGKCKTGKSVLDPSTRASEFPLSSLNNHTAYLIGSSTDLLMHEPSSPPPVSL